MSQPASIQHMTPEEFNIWEQTQLDRYELVDGVPHLKFVEWDGPKMMVGATKGHGWVVKNLISVLNPRLRGKPCQPFAADGKVRTPRGNYRYPDVTIDCGPHDLSKADLPNPVAVIEVLSKSTFWLDHNKKLSDYQSVPSIRYILLLAQNEIHGQLWTRGPADWSYVEMQNPDTVIHFHLSEVQFTLAEAYEGMF